MEKIEYGNLFLSTSEETTDFSFKGQNISVKKYFPISEKYDVIMITLQKSYEDGIYNPIKLDQYFMLNMIYMFTNIEFSAEDREDEDKLYDELESSGFIDKFIENVDKDAYEDMYSTITSLVGTLQKYNMSFIGTMRRLIGDMSVNADEIQKIVDNFDKEKFQEVINFAKAANGGRDIQ